MLNAKEARKIALFQQELRLCVSEALNKIEVAAGNGEFRCKVMHHRKFTTETTASAIADFLRKLEYTVDATDDVDFKGNNYRTIVVEW